MNEITNNIQRPDTGDTHSVPVEHTQFWSNVGSEIWNDMKMLSGSMSTSGKASAGAPIEQASASQAADQHLPNLDLSDFKQESLKVFDDLDKGKQGFVTREQLAQAVSGDPSITGDDAEALAVLYGVKDHQHVGQVADGGNPYVLTRAEVEAMPTSLTGDPSQMREANLINHILTRGGQSLATDQADQAFTNPAFKDSSDLTTSIKEGDVQQGLAGDCYFDSALAAVAATQPETIRDSIQENSNGTYTVTFKGDPTRPMIVAAPTEAELALYNGASRDGIWPSIMEKAFADHQVLFGYKHEDSNTAQDASSGGRAATVMSLLTGERSHLEIFHEGLAATQLVNQQGDVDVPMQTLENAVAQGDIAVVGTGGQNLGYGLATDHAYTVMGYQPGADGGTFELRNPWGDDTRHDGDEFSISGDQLAASIHDISFETVDTPDEQ